MSDVRPEFLAWRRRTGADRYDEVWEGVLHLVPSPTNRHQELEFELAHWLRVHWARAPERKVLTQVNVCRPGTADWLKDFRIPDLVLLTPDGRHADRDTHFAGGPDVVVEIRSPNDETDEKLAYYAAAGCREIWVIDRDTRVPRLFAVTDGAPVARAPDADGWLESDLGVELRAADGRVELRLTGDDASRRAVP